VNGTRHAIFLGMENTAHEVPGHPLNEPEAPTLTLHQALLPAPAKDVEASTHPESTEMVPFSRTPPGSDDEFAELEVPALPEHLRQIPFRLELRVPLSRFTLRDLQELAPGALLVTEHLSVRDLVLTAAGERLLLVELEAMEQQLAARVKRLAWRHKWRRKA
jgi:Type III flagellar switch regulator (C-ring) FliN C-term